jgi:hypothetical protein
MYSFGSLIIGLNYLLSESRVQRPGTRTDKGRTEMSELLAPFGAPPDVEQELAETVEAPPRMPVLITEQQVLFATTAALPLQPATTGRRVVEALRALGASAKAVFTTSGDARPKPRHYPPRHDLLEDSRMAREMLRL